MFKKRSEIDEKYQLLMQELKYIPHITYVVSVDFSYSNINCADGWGAPQYGIQGNLHGENEQEPSQYEQSLKILEGVLDQVQRKEPVIFVAFHGNNVQVEEVSNSGLVAAYHRHRQYFMENPNQEGNFIAQSLIPALTHMIKSRKFVVTIALTDGHINDFCTENDALIKASHYPLTMAILVIGNIMKSPQHQRKLYMIDEEVIDRCFDNVGLTVFQDYDTKTDDGWKQMMIHMLSEVYSQYRHCEYLNLIEALVCTCK